VLTWKYYNGQAPAQGELTDYDRQTIAEFTTVKADVERLLENFRFRDAQKEAMNLARIGNKYLADSEPWKLQKTDPERVKTIMNISLQLAANLAIAFEPFLPFSSRRLREMLNMTEFNWNDLGSTTLISEGHQLAKAELLFEKIEDEAVNAQVARLEAIKKEREALEAKPEQQKTTTEFENFEKLDIRVGTVEDCVKVEKSDKLLKLTINDGCGTRTIVSGIAKHYKPEQLKGKQVCFIANLPPRKLRGIESQGMILCSENSDGTLGFVTVDRATANGSCVK
jgi:methionyl-tRNA synthetase